MGRDKEEGDLWDDSALINAFDHALYHYKKMHGINERRQVDIHTSIDGKAKPEAGMDTTPISKDDADQETVGDIMSNVRVQNGSSHFTVFDTALELGESRTIESVEDYKVADLVGTESFVEALNVQHTQVDNSCPCPSGNIEYEKLLKQYYELEEKRQEILQQLQQFGAYGYQYPAEGSGFDARWGACSASAYHSVPASQAPPTSCVFSCCSHACCCSVAPCHFSASIGGTCIDKGCAETCALAVAGKSSQGLDNDVLRTAVEAVDKAINSTMTKNSGDSMEENRVKENGNDAEGETVQCISSGTDLSVVLNAWYSAGLYTGKYLTEQSIMKK